MQSRLERGAPLPMPKEEAEERFNFILNNPAVNLFEANNEYTDQKIREVIICMFKRIFNSDGKIKNEAAKEGLIAFKINNNDGLEWFLQDSESYEDTQLRFEHFFISQLIESKIKTKYMKAAIEKSKYKDKLISFFSHRAEEIKTDGFKKIATEISNHFTRKTTNEIEEKKENLSEESISQLKTKRNMDIVRSFVSTLEAIISDRKLPIGPLISFFNNIHSKKIMMLCF